MIKALSLIVIFASLANYAAGRIAAKSVLTKVSSQLKVANFGLGVYSRSSIISAISQALRGDDEEDVRENLNQAIVTLAVMDIGGGALIPVTETVVEAISKDATFKATSDAWKDYNVKIKDQLNTDLKTLDDTAVKRVLKEEKSKVLKAFENDVAKLQTVPGKAKTYNLIKKAQKWLKVKSVTKVLGPIFDVVGIGIDAWSLSSAIKDCNTDPATCNYGEIASASLGIASSIVGIATFVASLVVSSSVLGPVGAVVGLVLAIGATLIELFYEPPVDHAKIERERKFSMMMELDRYSRYQLYTASKILSDNEVDRNDLYVVNQGHMPMWGILSPRPVLDFGKRKPLGLKRILDNFNMKCEDPKQNGESVNGYVCEYLLESNHYSSSGFNLGHGFYGLTKNAGTRVSVAVPPELPPYEGSMILVNTDQVQSNVLQENNMFAHLRGFEIRTDMKTNDNKPYDDLVALGAMPTIRSDQKIVIRTGAGNDALNIDGGIGLIQQNYQNILDADLGSEGHNTLSFNAYDGVTYSRNIHYDARSGVWSTFGNGYQHQFGTIKNVEILAGSDYSDRITMHATKKGENGFDFTVIKRKGYSEYQIDVGALAKQTETRHFKIIDSTEGGLRDAPYNPCDAYSPSLEFLNFDMEASSNDVLYQGGKIKIYGLRQNAKKRRSAMRQGSKLVKRSSYCSGEDSIGIHEKGGQDGKVLLATVTVHSKCSLAVSSSNVNGGCMAYMRSISNLDIVFYEGMNTSADLSSSIEMSDKSDLVHLVCPDSPVQFSNSINMKGSTGDIIILSSSRFLEPCGIDGYYKRMLINRKYWKTLNGVVKYKWELELHNNPKFPVKIGEESGWKHVLMGVEKIVNEYGDVVVNLRSGEGEFYDLYHEYTKATMKSVGVMYGSTRSSEIRNDLLTCIQSDPSIPKPDVCE